NNRVAVLLKRAGRHTRASQIHLQNSRGRMKAKTGPAIGAIRNALHKAANLYPLRIKAAVQELTPGWMDRFGQLSCSEMSNHLCHRNSGIGSYAFHLHEIPQFRQIPSYRWRIREIKSDGRILNDESPIVCLKASYDPAQLEWVAALGFAR